MTPITRNHCRIDVVAAWNLFRWVPLGPELLKFVFAKFVEQDRQTMEQQSEGLEAQSAPDADRRRRPSRQMVFRIEGGAYWKSRKNGRRDETSAGRAGYAEVEELRSFSAGV